ncbi:MAG: hypothetical protein Q8P24_16785 [Desulfobacterales bacterium]|nr:hypothetical protein [Desulfobacterales bacterium]
MDRPTIRINEEKIQRADERETGFNKYRRGEFGNDPKAKNTKHPLSDALSNMQELLRKSADGGVWVSPAPLPGDPEKITRHIKETAYFFRADLVGVCKLPSYAVSGCSNPTGEPVELNHKYAIAVLVDQDWKTSGASTGDDWISTSRAYRSYTASGFTACMLADYIRRLGYPARAHLQGK